MNRIDDNTDSFYGWIKENRYSNFLAVFCAVIPLLAEPFLGLFQNRFLWPEEEWGNYWKKLFEYQILFQVVNILFISYALYKLTRMRFLQVRTVDRENRLHKYVTDTFGPNSTLARNTSEDLFKRINTGLKQFYYSWVSVWSIWLIMYIIKMIYTFYRVNQEVFCKGNNYEFLFRFNGFLENFLNMIGSFVLFFIYMDITVSTVKVGTLTGKGHSNLQIGIFTMIIIGTCISMVDFFSIIGCADYDKTQFFLRLFIGIIASISIITVLGRMNTSFLQIPQSLMMCLYLYAAIQMFYPIVYKMNNGNYYIPFVTSYLMTCLNLFVFGGKIALFLVLLWIAKKNRFLFFLLHKANSLSDASFMLSRFNKSYRSEEDE